MLSLSMSIFDAASTSQSPTRPPPTTPMAKTPATKPENKPSSTTSEVDAAKSTWWSTIRRWPAMSICLSVTSILYTFLFCLAAAGWPGAEPTSNCYEDYLVTPDCFCEKIWGDKPGDVWIAQPMNTLTNLYFVMVGLLIAYAVDSRQFPSNDWWTKHKDDSNNNTNLIVQDNIYAICMALDACILGVGSTFLHASFTTWGRQADMTAMYLIGTFMNIYPLVRERYITREQAIWAYGLVNAAMISWLINVSSPAHARKLFSVLMISSWAMEVFLVNPEWAKKNQTARRIFFGNMSMFCVAVLQWKASESGMPLCYPESIFQGHSLWHFQSAVGIGGVFAYYLAEEVPITEIKKMASNNNSTKHTKELQAQQSIVDTTPTVDRVETPVAGAQSVGTHSQSSSSGGAHHHHHDTAEHSDDSSAWSDDARSEHEEATSGSNVTMGDKQNKNKED